MRKTYILIVIWMMMLSGSLAAYNLDGIWISQADGSQYLFENGTGKIYLLGFDLASAKFQKNETKYRDIKKDPHSESYLGMNRVNDAAGNLHSWRDVSFQFGDQAHLVITDLQSDLKLNLIRSYWQIHIANYYSPLQGLWKRNDDGSEYNFTENQAVLKSIGSGLKSGNFEVNQMKIRNIIPLSLDNFIAENRMNKPDGSLASWDRARLTIQGDQLTITGSRAGDVLKLSRQLQTQAPGSAQVSNSTGSMLEQITQPQTAVPGSAKLQTAEPKSANPSLDLSKGLPISKIKNHNGIAVVLGNRDYDAGIIGDAEYAINDVQAVKLYLTSLLGYSKDNIIYIENATLRDFYSVFGKENDHRGKLNSWVEASSGKPDVFIYYSGHGAPDVNTGSAFLIPVDCDSVDRINVNGYALNVLYDNLSKLSYKSLTVVLESCFSGYSEQGLMLKNVSPVYLKSSEETPKIKNASIIASASGNQLANWLPEKKQSLFTYYLLMGIKGEADANQDQTISYNELKQYVERAVNNYALRNKDRNQNPVFSVEGEKILYSFE